MRELRFFQFSNMAHCAKQILLLSLVPVLFLLSSTSKAGAELPGDDLIEVPIRWCAIKGSPAVTNPGGVGEPDTDNVLWRRHERATDRIWTRGAVISFRSAFTAAVRDQASFPIIDDPKPPSSGGPGVEGDILATTIDDSELKDALAACKAAWDKLENDFGTNLEGPIGINLRRFVTNTGTIADLGGQANFAISSTGGTFQDVCEDPTRITGNNGDVAFAAVIDNSFTLAGDPHDALLGHELGHVLFLGHGNGEDDNEDRVFDEICDGAEDPNAIPFSLMTPTSVPSEVITALQKRTARAVAMVTSGNAIDPPGTLLPGDTVSDSRVDTVHEVTDDSVDIVSVSMAVNRITETTIVSHVLFGAIPVQSNHQYLAFVDLDGNPATGGEPSVLGFLTAFQGAELVTRVEIIREPGQEFVFPTPTVWTFQAGAFAEVSDPQIRANITPSIEQETQVELFDVVSIEMPNAVRGPLTLPLRIQVIAQRLDGELDRLPDFSLEDGLPIRMVAPEYPVCSVTPTPVPPSATVTVDASGLIPDQTAKVFLGDQLVNTGPIDSEGNVTLNFGVPDDANEGLRLVTVGVLNTALTADCAVEVSATAPFPNKTTIFSTLGDNPPPSLRDKDIFTFEGAKDEEVIIRLEPSPAGTHAGDRATLILTLKNKFKNKDKGRKVTLFEKDGSALPNELTATLPAIGKYLIIVAEQPKRTRGKRFRGDYSLTLQSSQDAFQTLETTRWVE